MLAVDVEVAGEVAGEGALSERAPYELKAQAMASASQNHAMKAQTSMKATPAHMIPRARGRSPSGTKQEKRRRRQRASPRGGKSEANLGGNG